jgi:transposase
LSAGQVADIDCAPELIADLAAQAIIADKGYDSNAFVQQIEASGVQAVIPPRANRRNPRAFDPEPYRRRNLIERFFSRIKHFRRLATRYDKLARNFMAFAQLTCAFAPNARLHGGRCFDFSASSSKAPSIIEHQNQLTLAHRRGLETESPIKRLGRRIDRCVNRARMPACSAILIYDGWPPATSPSLALALDRLYRRRVSSG